MSSSGSNFTQGNYEVAQLLAAVIPAFNEAGSIEAVVQEVSQRALAIVVDDGSTDDTAVLARDAGARVVIHPFNRGYDCALETGIRTAIDLGCSYAVTMDADGQHDPTILDRFNEEFSKGADLIVGVRDHMQRWSEELFSIVSRHIWLLDDPLCGMKGYRLSKIFDVDLINTYPSVGTELAIRLIRHGLVLKQIPVQTRARIGSSRFGGGLSAHMKIFNALFNGLMLP